MHKAALLVIGTLVMLAPLRAYAGSITLRSSARVALGQPVTLADVATLEGQEADRLGDSVLLPEGGARQADVNWVEVSVNDVRAALAKRDVNWGRISIRGSVCTIRFRGEVQPSEADALPEAQTAAQRGPVVRDAVRAALRRTLNVEDTNLRVEWDSRDDEFLRRSTWGLRVEAQPATTGSSSRQVVLVRLYEGQSVVSERSVRADVEIRTTVLSLSRQIERREEIRLSDFRMDHAWLAPDGSRPLSMASKAVGRVAGSRLQAGLILRENHVVQPIAIRRGDRVVVHCISGAIALQAKARALGDGRVGESVEMRLDGRKGTFMATVSSHGVAVLNLDLGVLPVTEAE